MQSSYFDDQKPSEGKKEAAKTKPDNYNNPIKYIYVSLLILFAQLSNFSPNNLIPAGFPFEIVTTLTQARHHN